jgi:hypothetical protein
LGQVGATVPAAANAEAATDSVPHCTVRRWRRKLEATVIADILKRKRRERPRSASGTESDEDEPIDCKESHSGKQFIVWLLHVADEPPGPSLSSLMYNLLVLGRPSEDEEVYERIGLLRIYEEDRKEKEGADLRTTEVHHHHRLNFKAKHACLCLQFS